MRATYFAIFVLAVGCGGSTPPPKDGDTNATDTAAPADSAAPSSSAAAETPAKEEAVSVPTTCANPGEKVCVMPEAFAKKLCSGFFPDLALYMFSPNSPWTRAYVNIKEADAWNSRSGPASDAKLTYDEEVLIISEQKPDLKGMSVSGATASYDFLRWDGTCASLTAAEMSFNKPPKPKTPPIPWRSIEDPTKSALEKDEKFAKLVVDRRKECKGATMGSVSDKCEKADKLLNLAVVEMIRKGVEVPKPQKLP
ncbi:MAG: hypothetical protein IPK82_04715 [Polyangiaceae bacterium]|nr:hypothetical protein [Polyangiaceae bacterium]